MIDADPSNRPDLYIGLVCAAGTDLTEVKAQIEAQLSVVKYTKSDVKVSSIISELLGIPSPVDEFERIQLFMRKGDKIRRSSENHNGVASLIVSEIRRLRHQSSSEEVPNSTAYLIDSLKNPAEVKLLDNIYGRNYYTVSVYLPKEERRENLKNKIAKSRHQPPDDIHEGCANIIIDEDEKGIGKADQNVQDTFPLADFFINAKLDITDQVKRFINLIFGEPFTTPTPDEYFMFLARATALRSCDLSRQVGAVITDSSGAIVSVGCNEVPLPGGGFFNEEIDKSRDNRDKEKKYDPNYIEIQRSLIEFISVLRKAKLVNDDRSDSEIVDQLLRGEFKELMSHARVKNLIEFGRVVHAEMHALSQAAALGRPVKSGTLYCTTFPCHGCARHIIASGISEVIYIEPYPKSLTLQLYKDEITVAHVPAKDRPATESASVIFRSFHGISPTLYQRVFAMRGRKDDLGTIAAWNPTIATPVGAAYGVERLKSEITASQAIEKILEVLKRDKIESEKGD